MAPDGLAPFLCRIYTYLYTLAHQLFEPLLPLLIGPHPQRESGIVLLALCGRVGTRYHLNPVYNDVTHVKRPPCPLGLVEAAAQLTVLF